MSETSEDPVGSGTAWQEDRPEIPGREMTDGILEWVPEGTVCPDGLKEDLCFWPRCRPRATAGVQSPPRSSLRWTVAGRPTGYSAAGEREWKAMLKTAIPASPVQHAGSGLLADFSIPLPTRAAPGFDLDNLLDPALSAVINGRGWFGGRRSNLRWIAAQKHVDLTSGVRLAVLGEPPSLWQADDVTVLLDGVYEAPVPGLAAIADYEQWVSRNMSSPAPFGGVGVAIGFADEHINLGDIGTGPVKTLIDGLWPILGGKRSAPHDGRIAALVVAKGIGDFNGTVTVTVVGLRHAS